MPSPPKTRNNNRPGRPTKGATLAGVSPWASSRPSILAPAPLPQKRSPRRLELLFGLGWWCGYNVHALSRQSERVPPAGERGGMRESSIKPSQKMSQSTIFSSDQKRIRLSALAPWKNTCHAFLSGCPTWVEREMTRPEKRADGGAEDDYPYCERLSTSSPQPNGC